MHFIIETTLIGLATYLGLASLYQLILAIASKTKTETKSVCPQQERKFLVLVPAYKEDTVILKTTKHNLQMKYRYHKDLFDYVVISDSLHAETNAELRKTGARVIEVNLTKSTKVKALQAAMAQCKDQYDGIVILDADNTVDSHFLNTANQYMAQGFKAIQGQRIAANEENTAALLDGLSEKANNAMLCAGANRLGFSSKLSGSGMVFNYQLFKEMVYQLNAIGGFDKELEIALTKQRTFIKYAERLVVKDQKVSSFKAMSKQRGRWIQAQYSFMASAFFPALKALFSGNKDHFHKVMQLALPPRALAPFALLALMLTGAIASGSLFIISTIALKILVTGYALLLRGPAMTQQFWPLLKAMPRLFMATLVSFKWAQRSRTEFIHTSHQMIEA